MVFRNLLNVVVWLSLASIPFNPACGATIGLSGNSITSIVGFFANDANVGVEFYDGVEQTTDKTLLSSEVTGAMANSFISYMLTGINSDLDSLPSNADTFFGIEYNINNNPLFIIDQLDVAYITSWSGGFVQGNSLASRENFNFQFYGYRDASFDTSIQFEANSPYLPYGRIRFVDTSVSVVPLPAAIWLLGSAVGALSLLTSRRMRA